MTIPEYDEECDCSLCVTLRNNRNADYAKKHRDRIKNEIERVKQEHKEHKYSTGTHFQEDYFR